MRLFTVLVFLCVGCGDKDEDADGGSCSSTITCDDGTCSPSCTSCSSGCCSSHGGC